MKNTTHADKPLTTQPTSDILERAKTIAYLKGECLKAGDTIYAILRNVSKNGMRRWIDFYVINAKRSPLRITWSVAKALDAHYGRRHEALCLDGTGFDTTHDAVRNLAWMLFGSRDTLTLRWL